MTSFASLSEAGCAALLERYCTYFQAVEGKTYQVQANGRQIDFRINGVFVEFHPIASDRAFINREALKALRAAIKPLPKEGRKAVFKAIEMELEYQYYKQRRNVLDGVPEFKESELIVCTSFQAFVDKVLRRFADVEMPSDGRLEKIWKKLKEQFKEEQNRR